LFDRSRIYERADPNGRVVSNAERHCQVLGNGGYVDRGRMKVFVEASICRGHAICEYLAPEVFRVGDRGFVEVLMDPDESMRTKVEEAAHSCPEGAIAIVG
jgi:ferredoxin